jgi:hypothetical protein
VGWTDFMQEIARGKKKKKKNDKEKIEKIMSITFISSAASFRYSPFQTAIEPTMRGFHSSTIAISDWKIML